MTDPEFESILEAYPVRLQNFEGPLDLLLHLIRKHEVSIYDIPIALITQQYLDYLELMQEMNLDVAGEFLVMAATLIHIKSRMLLPRPDPAQEEAEEDPREALMRRLLEHQKFKAAAELLHERETLRSAQWTRADGPIAEIAGEAPEPEIEVDSLQPDQRLPRVANAPSSGRRFTSPASRSRSKIASSSCWANCRKPRRAASRTCSRTCSPGQG
jgi:segregation and condensation protein A